MLKLQARSHRRAPSAFLCLLAFTFTLQAQLTFDPAKDSDEHGPIKNKPFTADKLLTMHKTLADGTKSTQESTVEEARDSAGRAVSIIRPKSSGRAQAPITIEIHTVLDLEARTVLSWTSMSKEANLMHLPAPQLKISGLDGAKGSAEPEGPKPKQLGHRMIDGLLATGTRV